MGWQGRQVLFVLFLLALPELGLISHQGVALNTYCVQSLGMDKAWIANKCCFRCNAGHFRGYDLRCLVKPRLERCGSLATGEWIFCTSVPICLVGAVFHGSLLVCTSSCCCRLCATQLS